ncbi:MAG: type II toxin-antitoxin system VapC family toxin [Thermomicrobiales bacterium]
MIVDSSAIISILKKESGFERLVRALVDGRGHLMSTTNYLECSQVIDSNRDPVLSRELAILLHRLNITVVPFTRSQADIARKAFNECGKGMNPRSRLNHCDCVAYALAKETSEPLLLVGNDFIHTDIIPALDPPIEV